MSTRLKSATGSSYTCQIFWKGDPGIEYFTIKFNAEETMRKWADQVNTQRQLWKDNARASARPGVSATEFLYMRDQGHIVNPYQEQEDDDDDDMDSMQGTSNYPSDYPIGRNESNSTLRSRSTTGESGPPMGRMPPRQFPMGTHGAALQVRTGNGSPSDLAGESSFFSPSTESPISTRSSGASSMFPFPRQAMPPLPNGWNGEDQNRFTAPAMPRQVSRDGHINAYQPNMRNVMQRPSLPPTALSQPNSMQHRMRSASSPDIANPMLRRYDTQAPPMPDLPPFPNHYAYNPSVLNRSQSSSPAQQMGGLPIRAATQPPHIQQHRLTQTHPRSVPLNVPQPDYPGSQGGPRQIPSTERAYSPEARRSGESILAHAQATSNGNTPTQLKVKVHCPSAGSSMVLVVPITISYQSLKDRIDAKLQRSTNLNLTSGQVKLKYLDDDDFVSIQSDEDVQMAFETWKESQRSAAVTGGLGEIELYIQ